MALQNRYYNTLGICNCSVMLTIIVIYLSSAQKPGPTAPDIASDRTLATPTTQESCKATTTLWIIPAIWNASTGYTWIIWILATRMQFVSLSIDSPWPMIRTTTSLPRIVYDSPKAMSATCMSTPAICRKPDLTVKTRLGSTCGLNTSVVSLVIL